MHSGTLAEGYDIHVVDDFRRGIVTSQRACYYIHGRTSCPSESSAAGHRNALLVVMEKSKSKANLYCHA